MPRSYPRRVTRRGGGSARARRYVIRAFSLTPAQRGYVERVALALRPVAGRGARSSPNRSRAVDAIVAEHRRAGLAASARPAITLRRREGDGRKRLRRATITTPFSILPEHEAYIHALALRLRRDPRRKPNLSGALGRIIEDHRRLHAAVEWEKNVERDEATAGVS